MGLTTREMRLPHLRQVFSSVVAAMSQPCPSGIMTNPGRTGHSLRGRFWSTRDTCYEVRPKRRTVLLRAHRQWQPRHLSASARRRMTCANSSATGGRPAEIKRALLRRAATGGPGRAARPARLRGGA